MAARDGFAHTVFLSTLSLRRATGPELGQLFRPLISIHALLAESDGKCAVSAAMSNDFYPRSPCGERHILPFVWHLLFQISIHALLAESDYLRLYFKHPNVEFLSTLSLRRATRSLINNSDFDVVFLSTLSLRRATSIRQRAGVRHTISIHALLAESDVPRRGI